MSKRPVIMNVLWTIMITFILTTYLVVNVIERECAWKGNFIRDGIIMPSISISCGRLKNDN